MNRFTIIKNDNKVGVDGLFFDIDCSSLPANFHALQWNENDSVGEVEWTGNPRPENTIITSLGQYASFLDAWKKLNPIPTPKPSYTETQICTEVAPTKTNGEWYQTWSVRDMTAQEIADAAAAKRERLSAEINAYRDVKIAEGFEFNGVMFDSRPEDQKRISGVGTLAFIAISQGATANDYFWHGGTDPFVWISKSNDLIPMDAYTVVNFGKEAAKHQSLHIFAARMLKDMDPIPEDYTDPVYWP